MFNSTVSKI